QLWQGDLWTQRAQKQHYAVSDIPAPRGEILDANGAPLAESRAMVRVSIAPRELTNPSAAARELAALDVPRSWITRATDRTRAWVTIPGEFLPGAAAQLTAMRGVYVEPVLQRVYTLREATRRVVGRVNSNGEPLEGLELVLDSLLRGRPGKVTRARDPRGPHFALPGGTDVAPVPGDEVVLTINQALQEISERALEEAMSRTGADGGDIVILDPNDGEIRAIVSKRSDPRSSGIPALTEPYEPGSVMKPFMAAALLQRGKVRPGETVATDGGTYTIEGRTIHDDEKAEGAALTLREVIRYSSNVGIVKFAQRLTPREEFEALRDFGFGTPSGVDYPAEAGGTLRPPVQWSRQSAASLAMGYEVSVTPVQLVTAYAAFANGGELLQPALVKEIRAPDGTIIYRHQRTVVRRVVSEQVARTMRGILQGVVEEGTGKSAELGTYSVAGKTGTARAAVPGKGYVSGRYSASFVGLFPADHPQYVIVVKLENPTGTSYYAANTAAPIMKVVLEAAIASRDAALDRRELAVSESLATAVRGEGDSLGAVRTASAVARTRAPKSESTVANATPAPTSNASTAHATDAPSSLANAPSAGSAAGDTARTGDDGQSAVAVFTLPLHDAPVPPPHGARAVPDVHGLTLRDAVYTLHRAGFHVHLSGFGRATSTTPSAGALLQPGADVTVVAVP
ncbi:MAG TPA: penicillin-binding transpeptidase domain-containing protein, partial [Gemmatimonadaceae bacterium]